MPKRHAPGLLDHIAAKVRQRREGLGLTIVELATQSGVARTQIWKIETARNPGMSVSTLSAVADALGVHVSEILDGAPSSVTDREMRLILAVREIYGPDPSP